jgi:hypothetical protein
VKVRTGDEWSAHVSTSAVTAKVKFARMKRSSQSDSPQTGSMFWKRVFETSIARMRVMAKERRSPTCRGDSTRERVGMRGWQTRETRA